MLFTLPRDCHFGPLFSSQVIPGETEQTTPESEQLSFLVRCQQQNACLIAGHAWTTKTGQPGAAGEFV